MVCLRALEMKAAEKALLDGPSEALNDDAATHRPRRTVMQKSLEYNNGLLWREEKELKKALYASLHESKKNRVSESDCDGASETQPLSLEMAKKRKKANVTANGVLSEDSPHATPRRTKVHAQRKFAQGSNPNSPAPTPVKVRNNCGTAVDLLPSRRPKTEDFLTFLCLRGTSVLPPTLDFFNLASKSDISSDSRCQSPVHSETTDRQKGSLKNNNGRIPVKNGKIAKPSLRSSRNRSKEKYLESDSDFDDSDGEEVVRRHVRGEWRRRNGPISHKPSATSGGATGKAKAITSAQVLKKKYKQQRLAKQKAVLAQTRKIASTKPKSTTDTNDASQKPSQVLSAKLRKAESTMPNKPAKVHMMKCRTRSPGHSEKGSGLRSASVKGSPPRKSMATRPVTRNGTMMTRSLREELDRAAFEASKHASVGGAKRKESVLGKRKAPTLSAPTDKTSSSTHASSKKSLEAKRTRSVVIPTRNSSAQLSDFSSDDDEPLAKKARTVSTSENRWLTKNPKRLLRSCVVDLGRRQDGVRGKPLALPLVTRPTRKTKEAAAAYLELLGKKLSTPDDEDEELKPLSSIAEKKRVVTKSGTVCKEDAEYAKKIQTRAVSEKILRVSLVPTKHAPNLVAQKQAKPVVKAKLSHKASSESLTPLRPLAPERVANKRKHFEVELPKHKKRLSTQLQSKTVAPATGSSTYKSVSSSLGKRVLRTTTQTSNKKEEAAVRSERVKLSAKKQQPKPATPSSATKVSVEKDQRRERRQIVKSPEPVKSMKPVKSVEPVKNCDTNKSAESVKSAKPVKNTEPSKSVEPVKGTKPVKQAEQLKSSETNKSAEPAKSAKIVKNAEPPKSSETNKNSEPTKSTKIVKNADPPKGSESAKSSKPIKNSDSAKSSETTKSAESLKSTKPVKTAESIKSSEPLKNAKLPKSSVEPQKSSDQAKNNKSVKSADVTKSPKSNTVSTPRAKSKPLSDLSSKSKPSTPVITNNNSKRKEKPPIKPRKERKIQEQTEAEPKVPETRNSVTRLSDSATPVRSKRGGSSTASPKVSCLLTDCPVESLAIEEIVLRDSRTHNSFSDLADLDDDLVHVGESTSIAVKENVLSNSVAIQVNLVDDISEFEDDLLDLTGSDFGSENSLSLERILTPSCFTDSRPSSSNRLEGFLFSGSNNENAKQKPLQAADTCAALTAKSKAKPTVQPEPVPESVPPVPPDPPPGKRRGRPPGTFKRPKPESPSSTKNNSFTAASVLEAPTYKPTLEEFQDPLEFIAKIRPEAEKYGICRIIPPASFKPECKVSDEMRFTAHNQYIHKMLQRSGPNVLQMATIKHHLEAQGGDLEQAPLIGGMELDLPRLYQVVEKHGGLKEVIDKNKWHRIADALCIPKSAQDRVTKLYDAYCKYLLSYGMLTKDERQKLEHQVQGERQRKKNRASAEPDECVTKGRSMSLSGFFRIARNTMAMWFKQDPTTDEVETKYWQLVTEREQHVCVHAGNVDSSVYGYGFPCNKTSPFARHPWNLKVLTNHPASVLRSMGPIMGVTIPTLHVGMLFTTGCWYRDPHCLPWVEYLHTGASKIWYGIPATHSSQFRDTLKQVVPEYSSQNPVWLPSDTAMVPPSVLVKHGVSLCRVVQGSGHFVVVFPRAFTSTICCGYSVSESVYFAHHDWLQTAQEAFREIRESCEPAVFSLERLLFCIAADNRSHPDTLQQILPLVEQIRENELSLRKVLYDLGVKVSERLPHMDLKDVKRRRSRGPEDESEYECDICRANCYVSVVIHSDDDVVLCLLHAIDHLQRKKKDVKLYRLLYTYDQSELSEMIQKMEDKINSYNQKKTNQKKSPKKKSV